MTEKDFVATADSNARKTPVRVAFITRRTSPIVRAVDEPRVMTHPHTFFRVAIAVELLAMFLVALALFWDAPLEQLADPMHTPNPAKAPWYFLGLQELLHYFPPFVAGVLIPGLVVTALIVIPYFNINVEAEGMFVRNGPKRLKIFTVVFVLFSLFLILRPHWEVVWVALIPTLIVGALIYLAAYTQPGAVGFRKWLASKPLSWWVMTWFLFELVVLTGVGTFFRGPGWSWVMPWSSY